jgi:hypothetical protein
MSKTRAKELIDLGDRLFTAKAPLDSLNQEIAEQFCPDLAEFTTTLTLGEEFTSHLDDSYSQMLHRELSDSFSSMMRPRGKRWFRPTTLDDQLDADVEVSRFLEYLGDTIWRKLYDPKTKFIRATKEADRFYSAFGQCVISVEEAPNRNHLYMRSHHLANCAWLENEIGEIDHLHRKEKMTARKMKLAFGEKNLAPNVKDACEKEPGKEFPIRIVVMPSDEYDYTGGDSKGKGGKRLPFIVCYVDVDNCKILREGGLPDFNYIVPRWRTLSGSQYAFSPAAMTSLPDARMMQTLARILMEAGEKMVDPPLIGVEEAVRDVNIAAGAMSWIDFAYDERLGEALRPLEIKGDMRTGFAMRQDLREMLKGGFLVNKLNMPEPAKEMTAYEVAQRLEEHVRNLMPIFEPIEIEYNTRLLDKTFSVLRNMNAFDWNYLPESLLDADITWAFESPLQEAMSRLLVSKGQETLTAVMGARQAGIIQASPVYEDRIVKDIVRGIAGPSTWRKSDEEEAAEAEQMAKEQKVRGMLAGAAQEIATAGQVAEQVGKGAQSLQVAGLLPPPPGQPQAAEAA